MSFYRKGIVGQSPDFVDDPPPGKITYWDRNWEVMGEEKAKPKFVIPEWAKMATFAGLGFVAGLLARGARYTRED